jgi:bacterioferritin (cytochrome b1)
MPSKSSKAGKARLLKELNKALGWELRAVAMYAHYAAYVQGLASLQLEEHFEEEATESLGHAKKVRDIISELGGVAVTDRDPAPIVHTLDASVMLDEALKTEKGAAAQYARILPLVKGEARYTHSLMHVFMDEQKSVVDVEKLQAR